MQTVKTILICAAISGICIFGLVMFQNMCVELFIQWGWEMRIDPATEWERIFGNGSFGAFCIAFVLVGILPPIYEELIFRFGICKGLKKWTKLREPWIIIISATLFMLWHLSFSQSVYQFIMGVFFARIYLKTDNILWTMLIHFINNAFILTYTYLVGVSAEPFVLSFGSIALTIVLAVVSVFAVHFLIKIGFRAKELPNEQRQ